MTFLKSVTSYVGFFIPSIISFLFIGLSKDLFMRADFIQNVLSALLIIILINFIINSKLKHIITILALFFIHLFVLTELVHHYLYRSQFSTSSIFILIETNPVEAREYLSTYLDFKLLLVCAVFVLNYLISIFLFKRREKQNSQNSWLNHSIKIYSKQLTISSLILSIIFIMSISYEKLRPFSLLNNLLNGYATYKQDQANYKKFSYESEGGQFTNFLSNSSNDSTEVYVLIIGESTTRSHLSLYDYYRKTNPLLGKLKNELIIYQDVISPHAHTIPSLNKMLTFADYSNLDAKFDGTVIQMFNKAKFKTYWLSNQRPSGIYDTFVTGIAKSSDERYFINTSNYVTPFDGEILKILKNKLDEDVNKKFIVIHLFGTHGIYSKRYPKAFNIFHKNPQTKFNHENAYNFINAFDNANLYNDYVISEIIKEVKGTNSKSFVLYLSDHGEEVFETRNSEGHTDLIASKPMLDIPFVLWQSEIYKKTETQHVYEEKRSYNSEDLIFTIADLAGITFDEFEPTKSIVNAQFEFKKRVIIDTVDYDKRFKK